MQGRWWENGEGMRDGVVVVAMESPKYSRPLANEATMGVEGD